MQFKISSLDYPLHPPSFHMAISPRSFSACVRGFHELIKGIPKAERWNLLYVCDACVSVVFATSGRRAHVLVRSQSPSEFISPTVFQLEINLVTGRSSGEENSYSYLYINLFSCLCVVLSRFRRFTALHPN